MRPEANTANVLAKATLPVDAMPAATPDHIRLGDTGVDMAFRKGFFKGSGHGRFGQVGVEDDQVGVLGPKLGKGYPYAALVAFFSP